MESEIWKDIPGYEWLYQASSLGRIKSFNYKRTGRECILKQIKTNYCRINLYKNKVQKQFLVHRLVWSAFNGDIPENMQINHINEDCYDNRIENLELVLPKSNANWGTRNKRVADKTTNGKMSKIVLQYSFEGELIKEWPSVREIKRVLGYNNGNISKVCNGFRKYAFGYIWKYK